MNSAFARRCVTAIQVTAFCLLTPACFRHAMEERQLPNTAFLTFPGVAEGVSVSAKGPRSYHFDVGSAGQKYAVEAGRYEVAVTEGDRLIARRIVFVAAGETKEVGR